MHGRCFWCGCLILCMGRMPELMQCLTRWPPICSDTSGTCTPTPSCIYTSSLDSALTEVRVCGGEWMGGRRGIFESGWLQEVASQPTISHSLTHRHSLTHSLACSSYWRVHSVCHYCSLTRSLTLGLDNRQIMLFVFMKNERPPLPEHLLTVQEVCVWSR